MCFDVKSQSYWTGGFAICCY